MNTWKIIITFNYPHEAHIARGYLESEGIEIEIRDELTAQVNNFISNAIGGVKLLVQEKDVEIGLQLLEKGGFIKSSNLNTKREIEIIIFDNSTDKSICPSCNSENISKNKELNILTLIFYFFLGALFPIFKYTYKCFDCEKEWKYKKEE